MTTPADPTPPPLRLKTSLEHLPESKQRQLRRITELVCSTVPLDWLVLFGSYARGDWVEDPAHGYFSDYDLLAIVAEPFLVERPRLWERLERELRAIGGRVPVTLLVHTIKEVNRELRQGHYFFCDVVTEGIALHNAGTAQFARPKAMNNAERLQLGQHNFRYWYGSANGFWRLCGYCMLRGMPAHAAFLLHQAVERYFHALTLVYTGYKHKTHDILWLADHGATLHPTLAQALPRTAPADKMRFDLLRRAYIEARYSKSYRISDDELTTLRVQVRDLAARVLAVCREKLTQFCGVEALGELPGLPEEGAEVGLSPPPDLDDRQAVEQWSRTLFAEGFDEGFEEGIEEGEARGRQAVARTLLAEGMAEAQVARLTGLSAAEVAQVASRRLLDQPPQAGT